MKAIRKRMLQIAVRAENGFVSAEHMGYAVMGVLVIVGLFVLTKALAPSWINKASDAITSQNP